LLPESRQGLFQIRRCALGMGPDRLGAAKNSPSIGGIDWVPFCFLKSISRNPSRDPSPNERPILLQRASGRASSSDGPAQNQ